MCGAEGGKTCTHGRADTPTSRLALLLSRDGVRCYACGSRLRMPRRVRWGTFGMLVVAMGAMLVSAILAAAVIGALTLIAMPWTNAVELEVDAVARG